MTWKLGVEWWLFQGCYCWPILWLILVCVRFTFPADLIHLVAQPKGRRSGPCFGPLVVEPTPTTPWL
jgi:hypothetical protein